MVPVQLCSNAGKVTDQVVNNSGMMSWQLDGQLLYQILFEHFSEDQIENSTNQVDGVHQKVLGNLNQVL